MYPRVTLTVVEGCLRGKEVVLDRRGRYVVGRSHDCDIQLALDEGLPGVSRHHFVIAFEPPNLRVCDLGSRNGTYLNGENIGQRSEATPADDVEPAECFEHELNDGDELQVQDIIFRVHVHDFAKEPSVTT